VDPRDVLPLPVSEGVVEMMSILFTQVLRRWNPEVRLGEASEAVRAGGPIGGLLEWDVWARIDRNRLPRPHKYASIRP
jgi:hypothetical protein